MIFLSPSPFLRVLCLGLCLGGSVATGSAQVVTGEVKSELEPTPDPEISMVEKPAQPAALKEIKPTANSADDPAVLGSSLLTRQDSRIFTLEVPPARGQILDRNGYPLAQTKVAFYVAINFPVLPDESEEAIVAYARERIIHTNTILSAKFDIKMASVVEHYRNRRWLPLVFSEPLTDDQVDEIRPELKKGLLLQPTYQRHYPQGSLAAHIIGYVGKRPPRSTGPIQSGEALWPTAVGANGLEQVYDGHLTGIAGKVSMLFEEDGTKLKEEVLRHPRPGNNLVTTIDLQMQQIAERQLAKHTKRGAMVVMDVTSGDILAMASYPSYDLNDWIPYMPTEKYEALTKDPDIPMISRAFQSAYPPASTFKVPIALAALDSRAISAGTSLSCPPSYGVGNVVFRNWNKDPEPPMNVIGALMRSCNTFFYQAAIQTGIDPMVSMAQRLGFGEATGLPLSGESPGFIPTNRWFREKNGYFMSDGDACNIAIGQGTVLATPLQVARAMAAVGNRQQVMKPRLAMQVQGLNNDIIQAYPTESRNDLNIDFDDLNVVRQGMIEVVNGGRGTGRNASNSRVEIAGKTGTGQWKIANEQNVAWFAGFAPSKYPAYSFAVIYEGNPGERIGGGSKAAPIVGDFFKEYLEDDSNLTQTEAASERLEVVQADMEPISTNYDSIFRDEELTDEPAVAEPVATERDERKGVLNKWFNRFRRR